MEPWGTEDRAPRFVFSRSTTTTTKPPAPNPPSVLISAAAAPATAAADGGEHGPGWPQAPPHSAYHLFAFPGEENYSGLKYDVKRRAAPPREKIIQHPHHVGPPLLRGKSMKSCTFSSC